MITKWAPVSGKVKPYFDVYEDPDAISQGGIPNRENALATGATQAWMDFGWEIDRWYEIKIYCKLNTGSNENGILRYYVDSVLLIEDTSVKIGTNGFNRIMITNYVSGSSGWDPNGTQIYTDELTLSSTDDWSGGDTTPPSATGCTINGATFK
jgi:hypothetical protein